MVAKGPIVYIAKRAVILYLTVVVSSYLTIYVANMGGFIDEVIKGQLWEDIVYSVKRNPEYMYLPPVEQERIIKQFYELEIKRRGLDTPFIIRSFIYLKDALTLDLGRAIYMTSDTGSRMVRNIILERLPATVLLFTTAQVINFFLHLFIGLYLSRHYGSKLDKLFIALAPTSIIPGWLYGIILILIFAGFLRNPFNPNEPFLPWGGIVSVPPPEDPILYALDVLRHMILPLLSWIIAGFFMGGYSSRTFFLIFSTEDFVLTAKAKGLPPRLIETRYILRPSLPPIITSFSLGLIGSWSGAIITETVFNWPGLGQVMNQAIAALDTPVLIGVTVIYAYLLATTVLILDIIYGFIDPRIKATFRG